MPTQAIPQGKHEAFESQFAVPHGCRNFTRDEGGYVVRQIESMWQAWLAGRASLAVIPAQAPAADRERALRHALREVRPFVGHHDHGMVVIDRALAGEAPDPWRDAVIEALTVNCIRRPEHEDDPVRALADLVKWERDEAAGSFNERFKHSFAALDARLTALIPPVPGLTDALRDALESIRQYGSDTLSGRIDGPDDRAWQRAAVAEMTRRARAALSLPKPEPTNTLPTKVVDKPDRFEVSMADGRRVTLWKNQWRDPQALADAVAAISDSLPKPEAEHPPRTTEADVSLIERLNRSIVEMTEGIEAVRAKYGLSAEPQESVDARPTDAMVAAYLAAQRAHCEGQDVQPFGILDPKEACRAGLSAAWERYNKDHSWGHEPTARGIFEDGYFAAATPPETPGHLVGAVAEGWKLVPIEPTHDMLDKGAMQCAMNHQRIQTAEMDAKAIYRAMLVAAPSPQGEAPTSAPSPDQ